ncbi:MAG: OmpH family outer membrane protein [Acidobacteria bacterium]|nr:OmpH family outer membrane protein [Acidobacteriota bacterium]
MKFVNSMMVAACLLTAATAVAQEQEAPAAAPPAAGEGALAYVDLQRVAAESDAGQQANARVQELSQQKLSEIEVKTAELQGRVTALNEQLQELQQKLQQGQTIMSAEARLELQRQIAKLQIDVERTTQDSQAEAQRLTQDAEAEVQQLQQELQIEFQKRLVPVLEQVALDRKLAFIFSASEGGLIWADTSLDLTEELIELLNAQTGAP